MTCIITYAYGLGRISQHDLLESTTQEYFLGDALGSVRQMTDQAGALTFTQSYDPYGVVTFTGGESQTEYGFTSEQYSVETQLLYLRARYYNPLDGRFMSRDSFGGVYTDPFTFNRWAYAHSNPVLLTDPSGHCDILCILAILAVLGLVGCSINEPVDICPPLPGNLEPNALKEMPRTQAIASIKDNFGIQLPPPVTYVDIFGFSHSASYKFVYSPATVGFGGVTPWFKNQFENRWGTSWGDVAIFETAFTHFHFNAYDIASVMVHEAAHAWQQTKYVGTISSRS